MTKLIRLRVRLYLSHSRQVTHTKLLEDFSLKRKFLKHLSATERLYGLYSSIGQARIEHLAPIFISHPRLAGLLAVMP